MEREWKAQAWIHFGVPAIGSLLAIFIPLLGPERFLISVMIFIGGYLVLQSKIKQKMRSRKLVEWGSGGMTRKEKVRYFIGYLFLALAIGFLVWTCSKAFLG